MIGSGSNLLVADSGFRGLALKLDRELATIEREGEGMVCGGGARFPSASAKAAGWGLAGIEFGVNIPGTAGGAVKMNANAYGGQLAEVLEWVDVFTATGRERRAAGRARLRLPQLQPDRGRGRLARRLHAAPGRSGGDPRPPERDARQAPRGPALRDQDLRLDLQEPGGPAGGGAQRRPAAGGGRLPRARRGGARFAEKHANFVENTGQATTADVLALMAEGRRRVHELTGVVLEPEVQVLGEVEWPEGWEL